MLAQGREVRLAAPRNAPGLAGCPWGQLERGGHGNGLQLLPCYLSEITKIFNVLENKQNLERIIVWDSE